MGNECCAEQSNVDLRVVAMDKRLARYAQQQEQAPLKRRPTNPACKDDFSFIKVIGQGSYGKVFLV